jgi:iron(III) transport system ATP-binding protein
MLKVSALSKSYGSTHVLSGIGFVLERCAVGVLTGPSGAGKTTLLNLIAGLDRPQSGSIQWNERIVTGPGEWQPPWERPFATVFQHFALWPHLTVAGHLDLVLGARREFPRTRRRELREHWLARLKIADLSSRYPAELSGGQQQRVAIARALSRNPQLLLMDEALSLLDESTAHTVWDAVQNWRSDTGGTILVVTHDKSWIAQFATQIFVLDADGLHSSAPNVRSGQQAGGSPSNLPQAGRRAVEA